MVPNFLYIESGICPFSVMAECNNRKMFVYIMNREVNTVKKVSYTFSPELDKKNSSTVLTLIGLRYHYRFHEHLTRTFSRGPTENIQVHILRAKI